MENLNLLQAKLSQLVGQTCIDTGAVPPPHRFVDYWLIFPDIRIIIHGNWSLKVEQLELSSSGHLNAIETPNRYKPDGFVDDTRKIRRFLHGRFVGRSVTNVVLDTKTLELELQFNVLHLQLLPIIDHEISYSLYWNVSMSCKEYLDIKGNSKIVFGQIKWEG